MRKASAKFVLRRGETCEPPNRECSALGLNALIQSSYNEMLSLNGLISIRRIESRKLGKSESGENLLVMTHLHVLTLNCKNIKAHCIIQDI